MKKLITISLLIAAMTTGCNQNDNNKTVSAEDITGEQVIVDNNKEETSTTEEVEDTSITAKEEDSEEQESVIEGTIINKTNTYAYVVHGDNEYCSVNLNFSGKELCSIAQDECEYPVDFNEGKVEEYDDLLGNKGFVISIPSGDFNLIEVYCHKEDGVKCIEKDYAKDYFLEDLDKDGQDELIMNIVYMAGGRGGVYIFRRNSGSIQFAEINTEYNQASISYDSENMEISIFYATDSGEFDQINIPIEEALNDSDLVEFKDI